MTSLDVHSSTQTQRTQPLSGYLLIPTALLRAYAHDPLTIGCYAAVARCALAARGAVPIAASDLAALQGDATGCVRTRLWRRLRQLLKDSWLNPTSANSGVKPTLVPTWGQTRRGVAAWRWDQPHLGKPHALAVLRVPTALLDAALGRLDPRPGQQPACISRYVPAPLLTLYDLGVYALRQAGIVCEPTPNLCALGLDHPDDAPLSIATLLERAARNAELASTTTLTCNVTAVEPPSATVPPASSASDEPRSTIRVRRLPRSRRRSQSQSQPGSRGRSPGRSPRGSRPRSAGRSHPRSGATAPQCREPDLKPALPAFQNQRMDLMDENGSSSSPQSPPPSQVAAGDKLLHSDQERGDSHLTAEAQMQYDDLHPVGANQIPHDDPRPVVARLIQPYPGCSAAEAEHAGKPLQRAPLPLTDRHHPPGACPSAMTATQTSTISPAVTAIADAVALLAAMGVRSARVRQELAHAEITRIVAWKRVLDDPQLCAALHARGIADPVALAVAALRDNSPPPDDTTLRRWLNPGVGLPPPGSGPGIRSVSTISAAEWAALSGDERNALIAAQAQRVNWRAAERSGGLR